MSPNFVHRAHMLNMWEKLDMWPKRAGLQHFLAAALAHLFRHSRAALDLKSVLSPNLTLIKYKIFFYFVENSLRPCTNLIGNGGRGRQGVVKNVL